MRKLFILFVLVLVVEGNLSAQYNTPQNYNWVFGTRAGVSFSSGSPVNISPTIASPTTPIDQYEGSASVSNPVTGALQFYTDGTSIWNSAGNIMAGSAGGLIPYSTWSTTQAALIVPVLSNPNRYYVFSIEEAEDYISGDMGAMRMYYCIVDMTLGGGLGDVVPGTLGTFFASPVGEKQIIIPGNNCDLWLVTHGRGNQNFNVYDITTTGINPTPVVSTLGNMTGGFAYGIGVVKASPNRLHIVTQSWNDPTITGIAGTHLNGTELYDFDPNTGIVSNCRLLDSLDEEYGAEFSPDNTKLYAMEDFPAAGVSKIAQYDITGASAAAIRATKYTVVTSSAAANEPYTDPKLAVNNKIYFGSMTSLPQSYLSVINNPNLSGAACGYANNVVTLSGVGYSYAQEGMPNVVQNVVHDTTFEEHDTTLCVIASTGIILHAPVGTTYYWYDGSTTATHIEVTSGTYWVNVSNGCSVISDTFKVHIGATPILGTLTICPGGTTTLSNTTPGGTWSSSLTSVATIGPASGVANGIATGATTISYTTPGSGGISGCTSTAVLTVDPLSPITGTPTLCVGGTTTLTNATTGGTWASGNTAVATIGSLTGIVNGVSAGTSTISYLTAAGCASSIVVTVSSTSPIAGTLSVCQGNSTALTDVTAGGTWLSGNPGVAGVGAGTGVVTGVSGGTANITYTTAAGCTAHAVVTVDPVGPINGSLSVCLGYTTTLTDIAAGGTWSSTNPGVATIVAGTGLVTGVSVGTTTISYLLPTGCFATAVLSVITVAPINGNPIVCIGSTTSLSSSSTGGTWSSGNPGVATVGAASGIVNGIAIGTATITYTIGGGCTNTIVVTVDPLPAPILGLTSICEGFTASLTDASGGGTWSSSNPLVATVGPVSGIVSGVAGGSVTITYKLPTGCFTTVPFTVNPTPPSISGPANVCIGSSATLTDVTGGGTWLSGTASVASIGFTTGVVTGNSAGFTIITYTLPTGCSITTTVNVGTLPAAPLTVNLDYCQGDPASPLTAIGSGLQWYTAASGGTPLGSAPVPTTAVPGITTWYVSQDIGCEGPRAPLTVTVHLKVPRPFILPESPSTCAFAPISYNYNGVTFTGETFAWTIPTNASITSGSASSSGIVVTFDTTMAQNFVFLTVGDGYAPCNVTDSVPMIVNMGSPDAEFYIKPNVCVGDTITVALTHIGPGVSDYQWDFGAPGTYDMVVASSNHGGPFGIVWPTPGIKIVTMTAISVGNCPSKPVSDTFDVHDLPDATFGMAPKSSGPLCLEDSILFSAHLKDATCAYLWQPAHCFNNNNQPDIWGKVEQGRTEITLTVTDAFGCTASTSQQITPDACCTVLFPTAFTPNGDGLNDVYRPILSGYHNFHEFRIVNRWGQTVFESANTYPSWNGSFNGVPQDMGVYFYYIKYDCGSNTIEEKGDVTLVR